VAPSSGRVRGSSVQMTTSRRQTSLATLITTGTLCGGLLGLEREAHAAEEPEADAPPPPPPPPPQSIFVAGATGATGSLVTKRLASVAPDVNLIAACRSATKAAELKLNETGATIVENLDVTDVNSIKRALKAAPGGVPTTVVCATGFVPGWNVLKMGELAHAVDNVGTKNLVDACVELGVKNFVLVSSILTNGRAIGQEKSPGFVITNAFGGVLDEKLEAELYLRKSGLRYAIVRPGGLKDAGVEPAGPIVLAAEDSAFSGEIGRDRVAEVVAEYALRTVGLSAIPMNDMPGMSMGAGEKVHTMDGFKENHVVEIIEKTSCIGDGDGCPSSPALGVDTSALKAFA